MMKKQVLPNRINHLIGKQVKSVSYLSDTNCEELGWYAIPPVIEFTDGTLLVLQSDDEANDGGAGLVIPPDDSGNYLLYSLRR